MTTYPTDRGTPYPRAGNRMKRKALCEDSWISHPCIDNGGMSKIKSNNFLMTQRLRHWLWRNLELKYIMYIHFSQLQ
jgi:hypothetical protein